MNPIYPCIAVYFVIINDYEGKTISSPFTIMKPFILGVSNWSIN